MHRRRANEVNSIEDKTAVVKRERQRARRLEKQAEVLTSEIDKLKAQLIEKGQQQFHGSLGTLAQETPEVMKLHKQVEFYKNEAKMLRSQLDAQRPEKVLELQGTIKVSHEEQDKLRDEIKTLRNLMGRQERAINQSKDLDSDYASKLQSIIGDLTVAKDENRRLRENLEAANKTAKSRTAIEEGMRRKVEALDRKVRAQKELLKDKTEQLMSSHVVASAPQAAAVSPVQEAAATGAGAGAGADEEATKAAKEEAEGLARKNSVS